LALAPFLAYFDGGKERYNLCPTEAPGAFAQGGFDLAPPGRLAGPQQQQQAKQDELQLYCSGSASALLLGLGDDEWQGHGLAEPSEPDADKAVDEVLGAQGWFLRGFRAAQDPRLVRAEDYDDEEQAAAAVAAATAVKSPVAAAAAKAAQSARKKPARGPLLPWLQLDALVPDSTQLAVAPVAGGDKAAVRVPVALVEPGSALPAPPAPASSNGTRGRSALELERGDVAGIAALLPRSVAARSSPPNGGADDAEGELSQSPSLAQHSHPDGLADRALNELYPARMDEGSRPDAVLAGNSSATGAGGGGGAEAWERDRAARLVQILAGEALLPPEAEQEFAAIVQATRRSRRSSAGGASASSASLGSFAHLAFAPPASAAATAALAAAAAFPEGVASRSALEVARRTQRGEADTTAAQEELLARAMAGMFAAAAAAAVAASKPPAPAPAPAAGPAASAKPGILRKSTRGSGGAAPVAPASSASAPASGSSPAAAPPATTGAPVAAAGDSAAPAPLPRKASRPVSFSAAGADDAPPSAQRVPSAAGAGSSAAKAAKAAKKEKEKEKEKERGSSDRAPRLPPAPVIVATASQRSQLFSAARTGQHTSVAILFGSGVGANEAEEGSGIRCVHIACQLNDKKMFKLCLKAGADINAQTVSVFFGNTDAHTLARAQAHAQAMATSAQGSCDRSAGVAF
jgi:hypothetical protein